MSEQPSGSEYLKIGEAARFLGVTQRWVYRRIAAGDLPASKVGGLYFIRRADLQTLLEQGRVTRGGTGPLSEAALTPPRCGYCYRVLESDSQIGEVCRQEGCMELVCTACLAEGIHHCARHFPSREQRLQEALRLYQQKAIPLLVKANAARLRELNFLGRLQERLARFTSIAHPMSGETITLESWDAIQQQGDARDEVMRLQGRVVFEASAASQYPLNAWLFYALPQPRSKKGLPLELSIRVLSRLPEMVRDGFDTRPLGMDELTEHVNRIAEQAVSAPCFRLVVLCAVTGWDADARQVIQGGRDGGLVHRHALLYLYDAEKGELIYNNLDERARRYAELFVPQLASEELAEVARDVEKALGMFESLSLDYAVESLTYSPQRIRQAFDELVKTRRYVLAEVPGIGLTLVRAGHL